MKITLDLTEEEIEKLNQLIGIKDKKDKEDIRYVIKKLIETSYDFA